MNNKDYLLLEYLCEKYGADVIEEGFLKKLAPLAVVTGLTLGGAGLTAHHIANHRSTESEPKKEVVIPIEDQIPNYHETVQAVKNYIEWAVGCIDHDYTEVEINPETLVKLCYKYKYDLPMLMAALHCESHFGITPRAKRTGSPCSIGCWDNDIDKVHYDDQNKAVEDYIKIMQNNFIRGRSYADAFADGNLVNGIGKRYASKKDYEKTLRGMRNRAIRKFPNLNNQSYYTTTLS